LLSPQDGIAEAEEDTATGMDYQSRTDTSMSTAKRLVAVHGW